MADRGNHRVRKVTSAGAVTTLAGKGGDGSDDGTSAAATFSSPTAVGIGAGERHSLKACAARRGSPERAEALG